MKTTFRILTDKVGGMTFWKQILQSFRPLSLSLFSSLFFFFRFFFPLRRTALSERLEQAMLSPSLFVSVPWAFFRWARRWGRRKLRHHGHEKKYNFIRTKISKHRIRGWVHQLVWTDLLHPLLCTQAWSLPMGPRSSNCEIGDHCFWISFPYSITRTIFRNRRDETKGPLESKLWYLVQTYCTIIKKTHFVIKSISSALFHLKVSTAREIIYSFDQKKKRRGEGWKGRVRFHKMGRRRVMVESGTRQYTSFLHSNHIFTSITCDSYNW